MPGSVLSDAGLSDLLARRIAAMLEAEKDALIDDSGGPLVRMAARRYVWPRIQAAVPGLAGAAVAEFRTEFGKYTVNDLIDWLGK